MAKSTDWRQLDASRVSFDSMETRKLCWVWLTMAMSQTLRAKYETD